MHNVDDRALRSWMLEAPDMGPLTGRLGHSTGTDALEEALGLPVHLEFALDKVAPLVDPSTAPRELLASIPFHSLCRGLFLPLSGLHPERAGAMFGVECPVPPSATEKDELIATFLQRSLGLSLEQKLGCVLGDPFQGKPSRFRRDSLVRLLLSVEMVSRRSVLDRLTQVGDVSVLFAQRAPRIKSDPPLTAAEVLVTLEHLGTAGRRRQFELLRSILERCGRMEAYFLAKLVMRKAGFGYDYQGPLLARVVAEHLERRPRPCSTPWP